MEAKLLSRRDENVLDKIKDPESNPLTAMVVDPSLPKDPIITDMAVYERVSKRERDVILAMQQLEMQLASLKVAEKIPDPIQEYQTCISHLGELITDFPRYASARNNRAQALRRLYGDNMLLQMKDQQALIPNANNQEKSQAALTALADLDEAIALLTPKSLFASISPQAAKTLSLAHTQRAAIYHMTSKSVSKNPLLLDQKRGEATWTKLDFEGAASRDFALGGRYGNEIAKGLAVSTNPTAKLCGQIVREAMKKEYGPAFEGY
ncbi:hypothetical protein BX600DRAFT_506495 [Xylariales sp. PMI_506]|nr:hypothetical protein BX600DRAFT_506495 [Xylariales sp. PMI_506]